MEAQHRWMSVVGVCTLTLAATAVAENNAGTNPRIDWVQNAHWYQLTLDQFANGDTANDVAGQSPWSPALVHNKPYFGGDFAGLLQQAKALRKIGFDALLIDLTIPESHPQFSSPTPVPSCFLSNTPADQAATDAMGMSATALTELGQVVESLHKMGFRVVLRPAASFLKTDGWQSKVTSERWFGGDERLKGIDGWALPMDTASVNEMAAIRRLMHENCPDAALLACQGNTNTLPSAPSHSGTAMSDDSSQDEECSRTWKTIHKLSFVDGVVLPDAFRSLALATNQCLGDSVLPCSNKDLATETSRQVPKNAIVPLIAGPTMANGHASSSRSADDARLRIAEQLLTAGNTICVAGSELGLPVIPNTIQPRPMDVSNPRMLEFSELFRVLLERRREHSSFRFGVLETRNCRKKNDDLLIFSRRHEDEEATVYINYSDEGHRVTLKAHEPHQLAALLTPQLKFIPNRIRPFFVGGSRQRANALGEITFPVAPRSVRIAILGFDTP